ncbi:MAG: cysteine--tRNA ligase [Bacteroidetes bacterium]|jgi:cysteinyl-tRNA synthetase|nr:cysteine--tRNA ligase [Bacteroidota bacterium]MBT5530731.1 cysteine--tRNA ligase [Cytophagia bacterium]MBT3933844.1 cysteine--tRNA ligase [Bacteroidota bacterium]MBT4728348.1 cysteine--tRNA ligase [Bacteroidota bacterium]MBT5992683.1 cysteine--tRNA ligase [Bacteroidota bacterium]
MSSKLTIYNSYSRKKEVFEPINPPHVGMYVCGPTVYGDPHLGHARAAINFDILFRYLKHLEYKVRYVRNITDVGHLENDADEGEDKIAKKARLEQLEPMEIAQYYTNRYHDSIRLLNCLPPSIEPKASGHIIEQIEIVEKILEKGFAYKTEENIYFDLVKYAKEHEYGKLSGKVIDDLMNNTRELKGQGDKKNPVDFALWKKGSPEHIMKWTSPWNTGFPGWHLECSAMGAKYLGLPFDIHGGGLDLMFPHHESEIAQANAAFGENPCKYWVHNNMITINGQKMAKSLGNFITLEELFAGNHELLTQAFSPTITRFFILMAHYRSTIDFSNDALLASEKGLGRLMTAYSKIDSLQASETSSLDINAWSERCYTMLNDDLNTARLIAELFEGAKYINLLLDKKESLTKEDLDFFKKQMKIFVEDILGLQLEQESAGSGNTEGFIELLLQLRAKARENKDWASSDLIRDQLKELGVIIKDGKEGASWEWA